MVIERTPQEEDLLSHEIPSTGFVYSLPHTEDDSGHPEWQGRIRFGRLIVETRIKAFCGRESEGTKTLEIELSDSNSRELWMVKETPVDITFILSKIGVSPVGLDVDEMSIGREVVRFAFCRQGEDPGLIYAKNIDLSRSVINNSDIFPSATAAEEYFSKIAQGIRNAAAYQQSTPV